MSEVLYAIVRIVAKIHNYIMHLNDAFELYFSDKEMHFIIIGLLGMGMLFVVYPLFKWLAETKHVMVIAWIYVFTLIIVITFAIEIGQKISNTGNMEFGDIMFGVIGFIAMFLVFAAIRSLYNMLMLYIKSKLAPKTDAGEKKDAREALEEIETDSVIKKEKIGTGKTEAAPKMSDVTPEEQTVRVVELNNVEDIDTELIAQAYEEQLGEEQTGEEHTKEI